MKFLCKIFIFILLNPLWISAFEKETEYFSFTFDSELYKTTTTVKVKKDKDYIIPGKIILTPKQKAAVSLGVTGGIFLLAGVGLLSAALVYSDYIEKNEKDFDKYKTGKNLSRGLFYGSMGAFGAGAVSIIISIPLSFEPKNKTVTKNTTQEKNKNNQTKNDDINKKKNVKTNKNQ